MQFMNIKHKRCVIYIGDDTKIICDLSRTQYYHTEEDSESNTDSDISRVLWDASSVSSYQLGRQEHRGTKNVVERNDVFDTQQLQSISRCPKNTKITEYLTESKRQIGHNSAKP